MKYWEDFAIGDETVHGTHEITADEIVRFAREFDPQPFHTDTEVEGPFGGLIASGWHTASLYMGMFVRNVLLDSASLGSPGVEELRWLVPCGRATRSPGAAASSTPGRATAIRGVARSSASTSW